VIAADVAWAIVVAGLAALAWLHRDAQRDDAWWHERDEWTWADEVEG